MNLSLDVNEVNLVLEALGEMPAKKSYNLLMKVLAQVNAQQQAPTQPVEGGQPLATPVAPATPV